MLKIDLMNDIQKCHMKYYHHFRTGKIVKRPEKEGIVGKIIKKTKQGKILFKYIIRNGEVWIITIE